MATIGNLVAFLGLDTASFTRGLNKAQQNRARATITMTKVDLWRALLPLKTLRRDQREAIVEAVEG